MHVNVEYILVGFMIFLILVVVQTNIFHMTTHIIAKVEQPASYKKASEIMDVLLLAPGEPSDWWDTDQCPGAENITSIGLALEGEEDYVLDVRKISRLNSSSSHYVPPTQVRRLLGLRSYYDFCLTLTPVFDVTVTNTSGTYQVQVRSRLGVGLPNANITAFHTPPSIRAGVNYDHTSQRTGENGSCTIAFDYKPEYGVAISVDHVGVKVLASKPVNSRIRIRGGQVYQSQYPLISGLEYDTASQGDYPQQEIVNRYVKIDGVTYHAEFKFWE